MSAVAITMTRAVCIAGVPHAEGERVEVEAGLGFELVALEGCAEFVDQTDRGLARLEHQRRQHEQLSRITRGAGGLPQTPWAKFA